jgi:hypothetical protein
MSVHARIPRLPTRYSFLGLSRTKYIRCLYGIFGREITKCTDIYGVYIRFWPTLLFLITYSFVQRTYSFLQAALMFLCTTTCKCVSSRIPFQVLRSARWKKGMLLLLKLQRCQKVGGGCVRLCGGALKKAKGQELLRVLVGGIGIAKR